MKASYVSGITDSEIELFFPFFQIEHFLPRMFQVSGDEYQVLLCKKFSSILVMLVKLKKNEKKKILIALTLGEEKISFRN